MKKTVGFIGLGTMGFPMANNLLHQGYPVIVYNRTADKAAPLTALGANIAYSPAGLTRGVDVVITMVSDDQAIHNIYEQPDGIIAGVTPGQTVIDCSTISPSLSRKLYQQLKKLGVGFLDAPVTGSKPGAEQATLTFMVGGDREVFDREQDIFNALGKKILHMGASGTGSEAKLAHNAVVAMNVSALVEGISLAAKAGVDPEKFLDLVQHGAAASKMAEMKAPKLLGRDFSVQFALDLMLKDITLAGQRGDQLRIPMPNLQAAKAIYQMASQKGLGEQDLSAISLCYEEWLQQKMQGSGVPTEGTVASTSSVGGTTVSRAAISKAAPSETAAGGIAASPSPVGGTAAPGASVPGAKAEQPAPQTRVSERRKSVRIPMRIKLQLSIYQWQQEGAFSGQHIEGEIYDLSENGLQIASTFPLAQDMFVVIHFPPDANLPPITGKIIRIETHVHEFRYGCLLSGLQPYTRIQLEKYIKLKLQEQEANNK